MLDNIKISEGVVIALVSLSRGSVVSIGEE